MNIWLIRWFHNCFGGRGISCDYAAIFGILVKRKTAVTHSSRDMMRVNSHSERKFKLCGQWNSIEIWNEKMLCTRHDGSSLGSPSYQLWTICCFLFYAIPLLGSCFNYKLWSELSYELVFIIRQRIIDRGNSSKYFLIHWKRRHTFIWFGLVWLPLLPPRHRISFSPRVKIHSTLSFLFILSSEHP